MRIREIIIESYPLAKKEFSQVAKPDVVQTTIDQYRELVRKNQFRNPEEKNINYWRRLGWEAFSQMVKVKSNDVTDSQLKKGKVLGNAVILQDDAEWVVLIPLDKETSVHYGRGTKWCTTKSIDSYFENYVYTRNITLIYAIDKTKSGRSVAISIEPDTGKGEQIERFNQKDHKIDAKTYTKISGLDSEKFIQMAKMPENRQQLANAVEKYKVARAKTAELLAASPLDPEAIERELKFTKDSQDCYNYILTYGQEQNRKITVHSGIIAAAANHIRLFDSDRAEAIGQYINFSTISSSTIKSILRVKPELFIYNAKSLSSEQHQLFATTAASAYQYASVILNGTRFPEGEPAIATSAKYSYEYAMEFSYQLPNRRFDAGEPAIATDSEFACNYAIKLLKKPFPSGEAAIATDPRHSYEYASAFAKQLPDNRFAAGEPAIATNAWVSFNYAISVLNRPFPAGEPAILSDDWQSDQYLTRILKYHRSPSWEQLIKDDPKKSLDYATERNEPFPAGELAILNELECAETYAQKVLANHRSESWEQLIKNDAEKSYEYAKARKQLFPAGEAAIAADPKYAAQYDQLFGTNLARP